MSQTKFLTSVLDDVSITTQNGRPFHRVNWTEQRKLYRHKGTECEGTANEIGKPNIPSQEKDA